MEIKLNMNREQAEELRQKRAAKGAIEIGESALLAAYAYVSEEKNTAIDAQDYEVAATWKDNETNIISALAGLGLAQPEYAGEAELLRWTPRTLTMLAQSHEALKLEQSLRELS